MDILPAFSDAWASRLDPKAKWSERRDAMAALADAASAPRLATGDYGGVAREVRRVMQRDSNVLCVTEALRAVAALARSLRRGLGPHARALAAESLSKARDKKAAVVEAAGEALRELGRHCLSVAEVAEEVAAVGGDKNPGVRRAALEWAAHVVAMVRRSVDAVYM